jgi:uncharacterized membrane protein
MCFLFFAYVLKVAYSPDKEIRRSQIVILIALAVCVALSKSVYLPICFSVLLIKKDKFKSIRSYFIFIASLITIALGAGLVWLNVAKSYLVHFANSLPTDQVKYILNNPLNAISAGLVSIKNESWTYLLNMFGNKIAWTDKVDCGFLVSFTIIFLTVIIALYDDSMKDRLVKYQKYVLGGIILASTLLIFLSLYIQWSPYAWGYITGVQGRYFLPLLPLGLLLLGSLKTKFDNQEKLTKIIYFLGLFPFAFAMISTVITYL